MRHSTVLLRATEGKSSLSAKPSASTHPEKVEAQSLIAGLRERLDKLAQAAVSPQQRYTNNRSFRQPKTLWTLGLEAVDQCLSESGLATSAVHDIMPEAYGDFPAASGFALSLAARRLADPQERRPVLWCRLESEMRDYGKLYGHGAESLGLPRDRLLVVTLKKPMTLYWTMEEALKSGAVSMVIGDAAPRQADLTTTRRLSLAAQAGKSAGLLVFTGQHDGATASITRWRIHSGRSPPALFDAPTWTISLTRARNGRPGPSSSWPPSWTVSWQKQKHHASHHFTLVSGFSSGALLAGQTETGRTATTTGPRLRTG